MYEWIAKWNAPGAAGTRISSLASRLPGGVLEKVLDLGGMAMYACMGRTRARVLANMKELLPAMMYGREAEYQEGNPEYSRMRPRQCARLYFRHAVATLYELFGENTLPGQLTDHHIAMEGEARLVRALEMGRGAILYGPHLGNFFYYYWRLSRHYPCLAVATASSPELRGIYLRFQELGCQALDYDETPPLELLRRLKAHLAAGGVVLLLGDFSRPSFPEARLFGRKVSRPAGAALLALEQRCPVIPFCGYRERGLRHRVELGEPILLHERFGRHQRSEAMQELDACLEALIRLRPEQWLYWFNVHERWK